MKSGDSITRRTANGGTEMVRLPPIDMAHLTNVKIDASGKVMGFHILPTGAAIPSSPTSFGLPPGAVNVEDDSGLPIPGAWVRITPRKWPRTGCDTLEAKVEILDPTGVVLATSSHKTFFPQYWSRVQIEKAVYDAFAEGWLAGQKPPGRVAGTTLEGVKLEMAVRGTTTSTGTTLKSIATVHPLPGQTLDASHQP